MHPNRKPNARSHAEALVMFEANRKLAYMAVNKYLRGGSPIPGLELDDVFQVADIALWRCCELYDDLKGLAFSTYAVACIVRRLYGLTTDRGIVARAPVWHAWDGHIDIVDERQLDPAEVMA